MLARLHPCERLDAPKKINWGEFFLLFDKTSRTFGFFFLV
jgi:hypothetical protein